jgi:hypothetical protein
MAHAMSIVTTKVPTRAAATSVAQYHPADGGCQQFSEYRGLRVAAEASGVCQLTTRANQVQDDLDKAKAAREASQLQHWASRQDFRHLATGAAYILSRSPSEISRLIASSRVNSRRLGQ